jgi:prevent-host-death family protein
VKHVSVKEARGKFRQLLDRAAAGDEVVVTRRGKKIARIVAADSEGVAFPSHKAFRDSIRAKGKPSSQHVSDMRDEESK